MRGIHHIIVYNGSLKYEFDLRRNLTVIRGDSATGKTTLIEMIQEYLVDGPDSGVSLSCDVPCRVLTGNLWKEQLSGAKHAIVFIDEGNRFVRSAEFAEAVKKSDNYYVIVTRESLEMLPVSVEEIYGIRSSGKYGGLTPVYHEFYHIYSLHGHDTQPIKPETVIVEDSNSGFAFFSAVARSAECISANGKSNIFHVLCEREFCRETLIIADGAAFGSQMNRIERMVKKNAYLHLYLPESFEWLLLQSGIIRNAELRDILADPSGYIDSETYFSWEQYFTDLLVRITRDSYLAYSKRKLNANYLQPAIRKKVMDSITGIEFD